MADSPTLSLILQLMKSPHLFMYLKPEKLPLLGKASVYTPNLFKLVPPLNKHFSPSLSFVEEY